MPATRNVGASGPRARATLDAIGEAVLSTDRQGRVRYLNAAAAAATGWSSAEAAGRPLSEVLHLVDAATHTAQGSLLHDAIREQRTLVLAPDSLLVRRDGATLAVAGSCAPVQDSRGRACGAVLAVHDVSAMRDTALNMAYAALHDALTGLPNRLLLDDRLAQAIALAQRRRGQLALCYLDLDGFKGTNDTLGHAVGDGLLQSVAQRLLGCVRASDTVSRIGGDEFVLLLPEVQRAQDAIATAGKVVQALAAPHDIGQHRLTVSASIGIAIYPADGADAATLTNSADAAMYRVKRSGRSGYQLATAAGEPAPAPLSGVFRVMARLRSALH